MCSMLEGGREVCNLNPRATASGLNVYKQSLFRLFGTLALKLGACGLGVFRQGRDYRVQHVGDGSEDGGGKLRSG